VPIIHPLVARQVTDYKSILHRTLECENHILTPQRIRIRDFRRQFGGWKIRPTTITSASDGETLHRKPDTSKEILEAAIGTQGVEARLPLAIDEKT